MSTQTEDRLRAAFRAAAQVITIDESEPEPRLRREPAPPSRRGPLWALVAAAAVVVAVAALAIGVRSHRATSPATSTTGALPTPTSTTGPVVDVAPQPESCSVPLPAAWRRAIIAGRVPGYLTLRTVDQQGNAYAVQTLGSTSQVVQIGIDKTVRPIYRAPAGSRVDDVQVDGDWVVMALIVGNTAGAGADGRGPSEITAIRVGARDGVTIRPGTLHETTIRQPPVVSHGIVYWATTNSADVDSVHAYDLATRTQRILATGRLDAPFVTGGGVYWYRGTYGNRTLVTARAGDLPAGYPLGNETTVDGTLLESAGEYAWEFSAQATSVLRMSAGGRTPVTVVRPASADVTLGLDALSGHYLVYTDYTHLRALDWTTGAATVLPGSMPASNAMAGGGSIALQTSRGALSMIATADLPALHC